MGLLNICISRDDILIFYQLQNKVLHSKETV